MKKTMKIALCGAGLMLSLAGVSARAGTAVQIAAAEGAQRPPKELVHASSFDASNKDGRSTGRGVIEKIVSARGTGDIARVKGKDGVWTEVPLAGVREADGGVRYTFPAAEARKAQSVQFGLDRAQARTASGWADAAWWGILRGGRCAG